MDRLIPEPIAPNSTRRVVIELPCGLFGSHYLLPIGRFPVEVTLELAAADAVAMTGPIKAGATADGGEDVACSTTYEISNVRLLADTISLDGALSDSIDEALLQGKPLPIAYSRWSKSVLHAAGAARHQRRVERPDQ